MYNLHVLKVIPTSWVQSNTTKHCLSVVQLEWLTTWLNAVFLPAKSLLLAWAKAKLV